MDKVYHLLVCLAMAYTLSIFFPKRKTVFAVVMAIGVLKEMYDMFFGGNPQLGDLVADSIGAYMGIWFHRIKFNFSRNRS